MATYKEMKTIKFPNSNVIYTITDDSKVAKNHGVENAGKFLGVGDDGSVTLVDAPSVNGAAPANVLTYSKQTLTEAQKMQARSNINADFAGRRRYVEEFKTENNTWDDAFAALLETCQLNNEIACTGGTQKVYNLTKPLYIWDLDVDFENCEIRNEVEASEENPACIVLKWAHNRIQKFGTVTGKYSTAILIDTYKANTYKYNRIYATQLRGRDHALHIKTKPKAEGHSKSSACFFNEFHLPLLRSAGIPLKLWCETSQTGWVNECHFYLGTIEEYSYMGNTLEANISAVPEVLVHLTNVDRCNFYNLDIEAGMFPVNYGDINGDGEAEERNADPNHTTAVVLVNSTHCAFYNPRTGEGYNAVQFKFVGNSFYNVIDAAYCKYGTIDSSELAHSDLHYNVWRGKVISDNGGSSTNADTLRIYGGMVVPESLSNMVREISGTTTINPDLMKFGNIVVGTTSMCGVPTLIKWSGGNIKLDRRFIALLPHTIQIMRVSDNVGQIFDTNDIKIMDGSKLELNKRYDIMVDDIKYGMTEPTDIVAGRYPTINSVTIAIGDYIEGIENIPDTPDTPDEPEFVETEYEFIKGFVRGNGTINTTSDNYKHTGVEKYHGGDIEFKAITVPNAADYSVIAFYDASFDEANPIASFIGNIETGLGGATNFFANYNIDTDNNITGYNGDIAAGVVGGIIDAEKIAEIENTLNKGEISYFAVSCPTPSTDSYGVIYQLYQNVGDIYYAKQTPADT